MLVCLPSASSVTSFPVPAPKLSPTIAWPVAIITLLYFFNRPIYGKPSAEQGLYPYQTLSDDGMGSSKAGKNCFTAFKIPFTLFMRGGVLIGVISIVPPNRNLPFMGVSATRPSIKIDGYFNFKYKGANGSFQQVFWRVVKFALANADIESCNHDPRNLLNCNILQSK